MRKFDFKLNYFGAIFTFSDIHAEKLENECSRVTANDDDNNGVEVKMEKRIEFVLFVKFQRPLHAKA